MPGGELSREGDANTALFSEIVQRLGWVQRGPQNENLECAKCEPNAGGTRKTHGIDTLFTFMCPYRNVTRGVMVDGKRYKMSSVNTKTLKDWLTKTLMVTQHLEESISLFRESRGLPTDTTIDTGAIVWDCHEDWTTQAGMDLISSVKFFSSAEPTTSVFLFHKDHLDKLATIGVFRQQYSQFQFLYNPERVASWAAVLTPELMVSDLIGVRYRQSDNDAWEHGVLFFGGTSARQVKFLIPYLAHAQLTSHSEVTVHIPCRQSELEPHQATLDAGMTEYTGSTLKLRCARLPKSTFDS